MTILIQKEFFACQWPYDVLKKHNKLDFFVKDTAGMDAAGMDAAELMDARLAVREEKERSAVNRVKAAYGEKYDPMMMHDTGCGKSAPRGSGSKTAAP